MKTLEDALEAMQTIRDFCTDHQCRSCDLFTLCVNYLNARNDTIIPAEWYLEIGEADNEREHN